MDPLTMYQMTGMMNDYRSIKMFNESKNVYHRLTPEYTVEQHVKTKEYFKVTLEENRKTKNLPVVVVTHHSPSKQSTHPKYAHDVIMNGAYSSNLEEFILANPEIKYWTHGHTHEPFRYKVGECEIICNPRGYKYYENRAEEFDPTIGFEI
jgi:DNA repair exonuclease SbcCD nuclease subunit